VSDVCGLHYELITGRRRRFTFEWSSEAKERVGAGYRLVSEVLASPKLKYSENTVDNCARHTRAAQDAARPVKGVALDDDWFADWM